MKTLLILLLFPVTVYSQTPEWLCGEWKVDYSISHENGNLLLKKYTRDPGVYDWGRFFIFNADGTYTEKASAPCGLDDNHYTYSGHWHYSSRTETVFLTQIKVINDRPQIYNNYIVLDSGIFRITHQTNNNIQIEIEEPWEKVTSKPEHREQD